MMLRRIGLQGRIAFLVGLTAAAAVGVSVYIGMSGVDETEEAAQREQLASTARAVADHVDDVLTRTAGREEHLAAMVANARSRGETELTTLLDSYPRLLFESDLYLLRPPEELVWSMRPDASIPAGVFAEPLVRDSLKSRQSAVGQCSAATTDDRSLACVASPVMLGDDEPVDVLLAQIDLTRPDLNLFSLERLDQTVRIELVAADGVVVAASQPDVGVSSVHAEALSSLAAQEPSKGTIHGHISEGQQGSHRFGYASIAMVPGWGVVVEPKDVPALAVAGDAQERLLIIGLAALAASLALAWLGARQVLKPLRALSQRAEGMAGGDLSTPVTVTRYDEVGALSQTLEWLRVSLTAAQADAEQVYDAQRLGETRGRLLGGLFDRQEEERQRLARELHEEALQSLAALALGLDSLEGQLATAGETTHERLTRARTLALALIQDLRRLAGSLRPSTLDTLGLESALRSYADRRLAERGVRIDLDVLGMEVRPSPLIETSLYRVAQEAIDNVAAHAQATAVNISLKCDGGLVTLLVADDGKGFDAAELLADANAVRGLGILSMQERMAHLGGTFSVQSVSGRGTRVYADIRLGEEVGGR